MAQTRGIFVILVTIAKSRDPTSGVPDHYFVIVAEGQNPILVTEYCFSPFRNQNGVETEPVSTQ
jgi:hypothetical protein